MLKHTILVAILIVLCQLNVCVSAASKNGQKKSNHTVTHQAWFLFEGSDEASPPNEFRGNVTISLFGKTAPITVYNFYQLAKGYKTRNGKLHYKNSKVHRIIPDFVLQMGDITDGDGTGGTSIYNERFADENFVLSHRSAGWVSMANTGPDSNSSQFFILLTKARWLDKNHVVFGKVTKGFNTVSKIEKLETDTDTGMPVGHVRIVECGAREVSPFELPSNKLDSTEDLNM